MPPCLSWQGMHLAGSVIVADITRVHNRVYPTPYFPRNTASSAHLQGGATGLPPPLSLPRWFSWLPPHPERRHLHVSCQPAMLIQIQPLWNRQFPGSINCVLTASIHLIWKLGLIGSGIMTGGCHGNVTRERVSCLSRLINESVSQSE